MTPTEINEIADKIMYKGTPSTEITTYLALDGTPYSKENHADFHSDVMTLFREYNLQNDTQQSIRAGVFKELMIRHGIY